MKCVILLALFVALVAVAQARPQSDCEKHRENAEKIGTIMKLIPKCKENGDYEELQCYRDSKFCVCYDKKGHAASPISSKIKECGCYLRRKEKLDRNIDNAYIPQCEEDGKWAKKQCWDYNDSCWCVDEQGERVSDIKAEGKGLNC
ncbi:U24-ctenitoxin-Pn1a-like [Argiope bruennichi]|uniref:U24-ctenitoxin-Pn1a like protein n=1 Tax=Argiope bruennichi TaxID=94029 RepID=A0A8T0EK03_ARGBR|nr:U24-ctenitoxin-Pn1a-like [Argiope bruennichi]KAF8771974.1 U24-ctenitoxin-Pn1a like protein [Argiope bruennichi]